jgi:serine/threonine-protein kinase
VSEFKSRGTGETADSLSPDVDRACDAFEAAWKAGRRPCLEDHLAAVPEAERPALLRELVLLEAAYRRLAGERPTAEEFLARFPALDRDWLSGLLRQDTVSEVTAIATAPTAVPGDSLVGQRVGPYQVEGRVGSGGMGIVYRAARADDYRQRVALKVVRPGLADDELLARFRTERQVLAEFGHPHIARLLDGGTTADGRPYFVMEFIDGAPLDRFCDRGRLNTAERVRLLRAVCAAVQHAHERGVLHRDLKPVNVLVTADGTPKITDFGLAKRLDGDSGQTQSGAVLGTPSYMAPEQAAGKREAVSAATDVYALGAVLYELLTGRPPFRGDAALEVLRQVLHDEPVPPGRLHPGLPRDLETVCLKCLEKEPRRRYGSAAALADELDRFLDGRPVVARPVGRLERAWRWGKRNPREALIAVLVLVLVVAGAGVARWLELRQAQHREELAREEARREAEHNYQQRQARQRVTDALTQLPGLRKRFLFKEAKGILARAARESDDLGLEELRRQVRQAQDDLALAARLDEIRLGKTAYGEKGDDFSAAAAAYRAAFQGHKMDVDATAVEVLARRISDSAIREELVDALDDWWVYDSRREKRLVALLCLADPGPAKERLRTLALNGDFKALKGEARAAAVAGLPPALLYRMGYLLRRHEEGLDLLRRAQRRYPADFWLNHSLGFALLERGLWDEAAGHFRAAVAVRPNSAVVHSNLGVTLSRKGLTDEAIVSYHDALRCNENYALAHYNLALALAKKGLHDQAIAAYNRAIELRANFPDTHYSLGNALTKKGRLDEAIAAYRRAIDFRPGFVEAHNNLGLALQHQGRVDEAIAAFRRAIQLKEDHAAAHHNLGFNLAKKGRVNEAIAAYRRAISLDKDNPATYYNLGLALGRKGLLDEAITAYREALKRKEVYPEAYGYLGVTLAKRGRLDEAIVAFRRGIEFKKDDPALHYGLGLTLSRKGLADEAVIAYRRAIDLKPDYVEAHNNLGFALSRLGLVDEAIACYRTALRLKKNHAAAHCNLGLALQATGQFAEALAALRRGHALGTGNPKQSARLVRACQRLLELDGRLPALLKGEVKPRDVAEGLGFADVCLSKGKYAAAARLYADALAARGSAGSPPRGAHYNAAVAALQAAAGRGEDAAQLDERERARLRRQALDWLRKEIEVWQGPLREDEKNARPAFTRTLRLWQRNVYLAGVRDPKALAALPEAERQACRQFWNEVEARIDR